MKSILLFTFDRIMETASQILHQLNNYNLAVNLDMLVHLEKTGFSGTRISELISHVIHAHRIWLDRIAGRDISVEVFGINTYAVLKQLAMKNHYETALIIDGGKLQETVTYTNTKGLRFSNTVSEIFMHVFNHATYHRGQINQLLVQEGRKPMVSDFIVYHRSPLED
jgi:uncharacterized damage-inducible protein DinB